MTLLNFDPVGPQSTIDQRFQAFHETHPEVYGLFDHFAKQAILHGFERYSAKAIIERVRWETNMRARSAEGFKCNDHFTACYARLWLAKNPLHAGFFELRQRKAEGAA